MLRHSLGFLAGLLAAPVLWGGTAWTAAEFGADLNLSDPLLLRAAAAIMLVGLVCGLLAGTRVSPLAALLPGAALLTLGLWPLVADSTLDAALPAWIEPDSMLHPVGPALPMNLVLGTVLVISASAPSRWRRKPAQAAESEPMPGPAAEAPPAPVQPQPLRDEADPDKTTVPFRRNS